MSSEDEVCLLDMSQDNFPLNSPGTSHGHCVVAIEEEHDVRTADQAAEESSSPVDSDLAAAVPALPEGKDKHLFVSYSSEDFDDVWAIVNQLEQRFNLSCIISARDFQSGKEIIANIKDSMKRSLKNVFMLTPNFVQSGYCKFERDIAFMTSIESGISSVIPVLLHECDIPTSLVTVTYIDGTLPGVDIPAKIVEALIQSELTERNLVIEDHALSRKYENGYCVSIKAHKRHTWWRRLKPAEYMFTLQDDDVNNLRQARVKLPKEEITDAINILNHSARVKLYDCTRSCRLLCCLNMCTCPVWFCVFLVVNILLFNTGRTIPEMNMVYYYIAVTVVALVIVITWIVTSCILPRVCNTREQERVLQTMVWEVVGERCLQHNAIVLFERKRNTIPTLHIMRYNIDDCKKYLAGLVRCHDRDRTAENVTPEVRADEMIRRAVFRLLHHLTPTLEELPDAPYNRHNVRKSKMCLCQMIEAGSQLVN